MIKYHTRECMASTALVTVARICEKVRDTVNRKDPEYYGTFDAYVETVAK